MRQFHGIDDAGRSTQLGKAVEHEDLAQTSAGSYLELRTARAECILTDRPRVLLGVGGRTRTMLAVVEQHLEVPDVPRRIRSCERQRHTVPVPDALEIALRMQGGRAGTP